ncbi:MAG: transglycosylase SLT domain-containing protein [Beijerinckiaceae bacterium]
MRKPMSLRVFGQIALLCCAVVLMRPLTAAAAEAEPVDATVCRLIESAARAEGLPAEFLTRLIWQESSFRPAVISPAGAQGIAQFMPSTAGERGVANPFDPEEAIPKAAALLAALNLRFGNLGLAAAAYNAGPARVANWLAGQGALPTETQDYVLTITGRPAADWSAGVAAKPDGKEPLPAQSCLQVSASIRGENPRHFSGSALSGSWGVQLAGSFSKAAALAAYARAQHSYSALLGDVEPMIIGGRLLSRGFQPFYQVRAPAPSREAADALCGKILKLGGACVVLRR